MVGKAAEVQARATELLRQGELSALAGKTERARELLEQAWAIAAESAPDVANDAAWDVAWLLVQSGRRREAAAWIERLVAPARSASLWPLARLAMLQLCHGGAHSQPDPRPVAPADDAQPELGVLCLGQFQIRRAGLPLPVCKSHKATSILRYLLTRPARAAGREELLELFWPAAEPQDAANNLHAAISALRRHLGGARENFLLFEHGRYLLNPDRAIEDDRGRFLELIEVAGQRWRAGELAGAREGYAAAVACYGGDYYVDSREPAWSLLERERLMAAYFTALERLAHIDCVELRFEQAAERYAVVLRHDSYREDLHYKLMCCYQHLGRRGDALRQYERCSTVLARELGLEPMPELRALYRRILGGEHAPGAGGEPG
jgi:DNA-binding SARP family transcriptional activator